MAFSEEDKYIIKFFRQNKHYGAKWFLKEFPCKSWSCVLDWIRLFARLIILELQNVFPAVAVRTNADKIEEVETLVLSQEDLPQTHRTRRQIAREVAMSQRSVNPIVKKDLRLICMKKPRAHELTVANKEARLDCSRLLFASLPS